MKEDDVAESERPTAGLYRKLAEVMGEVGYVQKRGYNSFHRYQFVTEADLIEAVREKLAVRNVVIIPSTKDIDERPTTTDKGKQSVVTTARVVFTFCDGDTGETHSAEWAGSGDDPADKGLYKAYTGALKYFLMKAFLIPTGDDPEADDSTDKRAAASAPNAQRKASPKTETVNEAAAKAIEKTAKEATELGAIDGKRLKAELVAAGASTTQSVGDAIRSLDPRAADLFGDMLDRAVEVARESAADAQRKAEDGEAASG